MMMTNHRLFVIFLRFSRHPSPNQDDSNASMIFVNSCGSAGLQCAGGPAQCTPAQRWSWQEICKTFCHGKLKSWIPTNQHQRQHPTHHGKLVLKHENMTSKSCKNSSLRLASTTVSRFSEHCISWDAQGQKKVEKNTSLNTKSCRHGNMVGLNDKPTWCDIWVYISENRWFATLYSYTPK